MIWNKPSAQEERRVRDFLVGAPAVSESALSLGAKLQIDQRRCRRVLDQLVREGLLRRRDIGDREPIYYRYPNRDVPGWGAAARAGVVRSDASRSKTVEALS